MSSTPPQRYWTCTKQHVIATVVATSGERFIGTNEIRNPQPRCPRGAMPRGTGYELCRETCGQPGHAEVVALLSAGPLAEGSTLYLEGHHAPCADCSRACDAAGVAAIVIGPPPLIVWDPPPSELDRTDWNAVLPFRGLDA